MSAGSSSPTLKLTPSCRISKRLRVPITKSLSCVTRPLVPRMANTVLIRLRIPLSRRLPLSLPLFSRGFCCTLLISLLTRPKSHTSLILDLGFSDVSIWSVTSSGTQSTRMMNAARLLRATITHNNLYPSFIRSVLDGNINTFSSGDHQ